MHCACVVLIAVCQMVTAVCQMVTAVCQVMTAVCEAEIVVCYRVFWAEVAAAYLHVGTSVVSLHYRLSFWRLSPWEALFPAGKYPSQS